MFLFKSQTETIKSTPIKSMDMPNLIKAGVFLGYFVVVKVASWALTSSDN